MRRLVRIIHNALSVLSLALAVGVALLWVRSYGVEDWFEFGPRRIEMTRVSSTHGYIHWRGPAEFRAPIEFWWPHALVMAVVLLPIEIALFLRWMRRKTRD